MEKVSLHFKIRFVILAFLFLMFVLGMKYFATDAYGGGGLIVFIVIGIPFLIFSSFVLIETIYLHFKNKYTLRNNNLILVGILFLIFITLFLKDKLT